MDRKNAIPPVFWPIIGAVAALGLIALITINSGCSFLQVDSVNLEDNKAMFHDIGLNLVSLTLADQPERRLDRVDLAAEAALAMLEEDDLEKAINNLIEFAATYPEVDDCDDCKQVATVAAGILGGLLNVDLDVPEEYEAAYECAKAFLEGAREGVRQIKQQRGLS